VLENAKTSQLALNPVTDKNISSVLEEIAAKQAIFETQLSRQQLQEIKETCNKDLRNAIQTLQFFAIGKTMKHQAEGMMSKKLARINEESDSSGKGSRKK
jgi:DNA polymerase III delta prime subunit